MDGSAPTNEERERTTAMGKLIVRDHRRPGWFWVGNEIVDVFSHRLGSDGKPLGALGLALYMVLARYANRDGRCHPSLTRLADDLCLSRPTVIKYLQKLEEIGMILKTTRTVLGSDENDSNEYILLDTKPEDVPGSKMDLPGGKPELLPDEMALPPGQRSLPRDQQGLLPVENPLVYGGQSALPEQDLVEEDLDNKTEVAPAAVPSAPTTSLPDPPPPLGWEGEFPHVAELMYGWWKRHFARKPLVTKGGLPDTRRLAELEQYLRAFAAEPGGLAALYAELDARLERSPAVRGACVRSKHPLAYLAGTVSGMYTDLTRRKDELRHAELARGDLAGRGGPGGSGGGAVGDPRPVSGGGPAGGRRPGAIYPQPPSGPIDDDDAGVYVPDW